MSSFLTQERLGKIASSGSTFRIELESVGGKPFHTGVQPSLYSVAKIGPAGYIVATGLPEKNKCTVEPVHTGDPSRSSSLSTVSSPADFTTLFHTLRPIEITVSEAEEGIITCVQLLVDHAKNKQSKKVTKVDGAYVHLFIGTSYGTFLACDALRGHILAIARFIDWAPVVEPLASANTAPPTNSGSGVSNNTPRHAGGNSLNLLVESHAEQTNAHPPQEPGAALVACLPLRVAPAHQWNPSLPPLSAAEEAEDPLVGVYVVHRNSYVVSLNREALDIFVTTALKLAEDGLLQKVPLPRPTLLDWKITEALSTIQCVGPAAKFVVTIKDVYDTDPIETPTFKTGAKRKVIFDAALLEYSTNGSMDTVTTGKPERMPALVLCGEHPCFTVHLVENGDASFGVRAAKAVNYVAGFAFRAVKSWFKPTNTWPVVPLERKKLGTSNYFFDASIVITRVRIDPTQQWGALYAEDIGRLFLVELSSGSVFRVLKGKSRVQFHWIFAGPAAHPHLYLLVLQSERQTLEVHDLQHRHRVASASIPAEAMLLPPSSTYDDSECLEALCLMPSGVVSRLTLDVNSLMAHEMEEVQRWDGKRFQPHLVAPVQDLHSLNEILRTCRRPEDFYDCATNLPLPQFSPCAPSQEPAATSGEHSTKGLAYFLQYIQSLEQICEWLEWQCAPGQSASRRITFVGVEPQRIPRTLTAGQTLHYLRHHIALVSAYHALVAPPPEGAPVRWLESGGNVAPHYTRVQMGTYPGVHYLLRHLVPVRLMDCSVVPVEASQRNAAAWSRKVFDQIRSRLSGEPAAQRHSETTDGDVLCNRLWAHLFERGGEDVPRNTDMDTSLMEVKTFQHYFYCGEEQLLFLRSRIQREETETIGLDLYAELGNLVFEQYGLSIFPYQLQPLTQIGLTMKDIARLCVAWVVKKCGQVGTRTFFAVTPIGAFVATFVALSEDALLQALEAAPLFIVAKSVEQLQETRHRIEALILVAVVRCMLWVRRQKVPPASNGPARTRKPVALNQPESNPFLLCLCRFLRLWELLSDFGSSLVMSNSSSTDKALLPLRLVMLRQSIPFSGAASATTMEEYILEALGNNFDLVFPLHDCIARSDAVASTPEEHPLNYLALGRMLDMCGVTAVFATSQRPQRPSSGEPGLQNRSKSPWISDEGDWNKDIFDANVKQPLRALWQSLSASGGGDAGVAGVSAALQFDQCCFFVGLLGVVEEVMTPLKSRLGDFWETCAIPERDFLAVPPKHLKSKKELVPLCLCGSRSADDFFASLADMYLFILEVHRGVGLDSEDAHLAISKSLSFYIVNDDQRVFNTVPSGLRDRLCILLSVVGEASNAIRHTTEKLMGVLNLIHFFMHSARLQVEGNPLVLHHVRIPWKEIYGEMEELHFLQPSAMGSLADGNPLLRSAKVQQNLIARVLRQFLLDGIIGEGNGGAAAGAPREVAGSEKMLSKAMVARIQSVDTYRLLAQFGSLLGMNENVASLVVLDFHLKHFFDSLYIEQQLNQERTNSACVRLVSNHLQVFIHVSYDFLTHRSDFLPSGSRRNHLIQSRLRLNAALSSKFKNWLKLPPDSVANVEAMEAAATAAAQDSRDDSSDSRHLLVLQGEGINWFTPDDWRDYSAAVQNRMTSNTKEQIESLKSVLLLLVQFVHCIDPRNLGLVRDLKMDLQNFTDFFISVL